jgi:hypothetical protein
VEALKGLLLGWAVLGSLAMAKPIAEAQVLTAMEGCIATIHLYAPDVYGLAAAQVLHQAVVRRGVKVYLFVPHRAVFQPNRSSLVLGLGWAGAELYMVNTSEDTAVLVCDSQQVLVGESLFRPTGGVVQHYFYGEAEYRQFAQWMRRLMAAAKPFEVREHMELFARWR